MQQKSEGLDDIELWTESKNKMLNLWISVKNIPPNIMTQVAGLLPALLSFVTKTERDLAHDSSLLWRQSLQSSEPLTSSRVQQEARIVEQLW